MSRFGISSMGLTRPHRFPSSRQKTSMEPSTEYVFDLPEENGRSQSEFGHEAQELISSFLSTPSCPSTAASSRRSSEVSLADSTSTFSCFSPTSPSSKFAQYDEFAAQSVRSTVTFPSRLPFFGKQGMDLDLCDRAFAEHLECQGQDPYFIQPAMSYASDNFNADLPHDFSVQRINYPPGPLTDVRTLDLERMTHSKAPAAVGLGPTIQGYEPDEMTGMTFISPVALRSSPPFVLPSQTLRYVDSPGDTATIPSLEGSPQLSVIDSIFHSGGTLMGTSYGSSERRNDSDTISTKRTRSLYGTYSGSRKRQASVKFLDQRMVNSRLAVRECTRATSTKSKKFKCPTCNSGFDRQEHYKRHLVSDTHRSLLAKSEMKSPEPEPKSYSCQMCGKPFNRHDNRQAHIKTHLPTEGKHHRQKLATVEESISFGWEELDSRINPALKLKAKKKGRSRIRE
jgi:hypothetical protein